MSQKCWSCSKPAIFETINEEKPHWGKRPWCNTHFVEKASKYPLKVFPLSQPSRPHTTGAVSA